MTRQADGDDRRMSVLLLWSARPSSLLVKEREQIRVPISISAIS